MNKRDRRNCDTEDELTAVARRIYPQPRLVAAPAPSTPPAVVGTVAGIAIVADPTVAPEELRIVTTPPPPPETPAVAERPLGAAYPVRVSRVQPYAGQPRRYFDPEALERLADSIQAHGQQQPIKICRGEVAGEFILVDGERRWRAVNLIWQRTGAEPTIEAFIQVIKDPKEHFRASVIANLHRADLDPIDEAAALRKLRNDGETVGSLADLIGKSTTYVDNYLKIDSLSDAVKKLMSSDRPRDRRLSVTAAQDIARSTRDQAIRLEIAQETLDRQLSITDTRALIEHRTGLAGQRYGGFSRKPSDDYKVFGSFLGRTLAQLDRTVRLDFERLYTFRDDEVRDRAYDLRQIDNALLLLTQIMTKLERVTDQGPYATLDRVQIQHLHATFQELRDKLVKSDDRPNRRT